MDDDAQPDEPASGAPSGRRAIVVLAILVEGGLILLALLLGWLLGQPPLRTFAWDYRGALWGLAGTLPMVLLFLLTLRWPLGPLRRIKQFSEQVLRPLLAPCTVVDLLGIAVLAGLGEEMLFRGVLQGSFSQRANPWVGLALASVVFGLMHFITPTYAVLATLMGAYLGLVWQWTGNLLAVVLMHALYDFLVLLYLLRGPGSSAPPADEPGEPAA
ncbi:MAG TPA: CPBP family intramembrane glutamic endopeptidase [Gemmataceae bacterium]|nr:CPBP family intramembrane glutamic endopeptidase [Gemmataceae bacterium]